MTDTYTPDTSRARTRQTGVSLIEVLIAVFVLAFGILGIAAMQAGALRNNQGAFEQSAAVFLTYSILDAMRASMAPDPARPGEFVVRTGYATADDTPADDETANDGFVCNNEQIPASDPLVASDLTLWLGNIQNNLNGGADDGSACGRIACAANDPNLCTVSVRWNNSRSLGGSGQQVVSTRSRL